MENYFERFSILTPYPVYHDDLMFRLTLYLSLSILVVFQLFSFMRKAQKEETKNGFSLPTIKYYKIAFFGIALMVSNLLFSSISLFFSNGRIMLFGHEKSIFYLLGNLLLFIGLTRIGIEVISFTQVGKKAFLLSSNFTQFVGFTGFVVVFWDILMPTNPFDRRIETILAGFGLLFLLILMVTSIFLIKELGNDPSRMEVLRLKFLFFGILVQIGQLIARIIILLTQNDESLMRFFSFYVSPTIDLIGYPLTLIFLRWSIFTPDWLVIKAGIIPKEFSSILKTV